MTAHVVRGETVLLLGESHVLSFAERVVLREGRHPITFDPLFVPNAVTLSTLTNSSGLLHPQVRNALRGARLITDALDREESIFVSSDSLWIHHARMRFLQQPLLVLCFGSLEILFAIARVPGADFHLPQTRHIHPVSPLIGEPDDRAYSSDDAAGYFIRRIKPFQIALQRLKELGFTRLGALAIPPPTLDDQRTHAICLALGYDLEAHQVALGPRYRSALFLNALMAQICEAEGALFLDTWPLLTQNGLVADGVLSDEAHLSNAAADKVALDLIAPAVDRTSQSAVIGLDELAVPSFGEASISGRVT